MSLTVDRLRFRYGSEGFALSLPYLEIQPGESVALIQLGEQMTLSLLSQPRSLIPAITQVLLHGRVISLALLRLAMG